MKNNKRRRRMRRVSLGPKQENKISSDNWSIKFSLRFSPIKVDDNDVVAKKEGAASRHDEN